MAAPCARFPLRHEAVVVFAPTERQFERIVERAIDKGIAERVD